MARINIEDSLWVDPRFDKLCTFYSKHIALGWLVMLWKFAQVQYKSGILNIPHKTYDFCGFPKELVDCEFVLKTEEYYYVKGSKKNFEWLKSRQENGRKGGLAPTKLVLSTCLDVAKPPTPTPTPTLICIEKNIKKRNENLEHKKTAEEILLKLNEKTGKCFRTVDSTLKPIISRLKEGYSREDILKAMAFMSQHDDWFQQNPHFINPTTLCRKEKFPIYLERAENYARSV